MIEEGSQSDIESGLDQAGCNAQSEPRLVCQDMARRGRCIILDEALKQDVAKYRRQKED